ncbi:hypothetical protein [Polaribacter sp. AHE13PA]|uniref:hypothetical protein n=1 Tax=Polaribacter sp. AHE13PA TaxID=2745562 RepID=UPI001C4EE30A|nr:hypothetical protein [Polaribacter sp. AHE13PA]QXP65761.1 hypothetical protein H0I28_11195 [Polaribacter sp. AHE13PA]
MNKRIANNLERRAQFALFVTSYLPLFILIIFKQIYTNLSFLNYGDFDLVSINLFIEKFGLSIILSFVSIYGYYGAMKTLNNIHKSSENGFPVKITDIKNKNSESIGYIATYIIPFAFQNFDNWLELISVCFIIYIIYRVYINSSLLLINPVLNLKYSIFEFEFEENKKLKNGILISKNNELQEDDLVKLYSIGNKMYYSKKIKK